MWSPEGFASWVEVTSELMERGANILYRAVVLEKPDLDEGLSFVLPEDVESVLLRSGLSKTQQEAELNVSVALTGVIASFLNFVPPIAVGLTGGKVSLPGLFFLHLDQLDRHSSSWLPGQVPAFSKYLEHRAEGSPSVADVSSRFAFVEFNWGSVRVHEGARQFLIEKARLRESEAEEAISLGQKLKDFVLCWPDEIDEAIYSSFFRTMEGDPLISRAIDDVYGRAADATRPETSVGRGRPRLIDAVVRSIELLAPDGTEGLSHKKIARLVRESGLEAGDRTIGRAIMEVRRRHLPK